MNLSDSRVPSGFLCTHAITITPADSRGALLALYVLFPWTRALLPAGCQPSPNLNGVGVRITLFEAFSVFTHVMACALPDPLRGLFLTCLSDFVASITPPGGSGRSE